MDPRDLYNPRNANRPADWRWGRAKLAASGELPLDRRLDDRWVHRAARMIAASGSAGPGGYASAAERALIERTWPECYWARHYWSASEAAGHDRGKADAMSRFALEARVLAGCTPAEIAGATGMHVDDVDAYEKLYFDARPRLLQEQWVFTHVIGPSIHRGLNSRDYDLLWKLFGYYEGPEVLDFLMYTFRGSRRSVASEGVRDAVADAFRDDLLRQATIVGKTWRNDQVSQGVLIQAYGDALKAEQAAGRGGGGAAGEIQKNLQAVLDNIPYFVGRKAAANPRMAALDATAVELTGVSMVAYSMGSGDGPDPDAGSLEFPVPAPR